MGWSRTLPVDTGLCRALISSRHACCAIRLSVIFAQAPPRSFVARKPDGRRDGASYASGSRTSRPGAVGRMQQPPLAQRFRVR